jgi:hypothetical protein
MAKWQPIKTAPRDGTEILLYEWVENEKVGKQDYFFVGYWGNDYLTGDSGFFNNTTECGENFPTHWMPLPEPPVE